MKIAFSSQVSHKPKPDLTRILSAPCWRVAELAHLLLERRAALGADRHPSTFRGG